MKHPLCNLSLLNQKAKNSLVRRLIPLIFIICGFSSLPLAAQTSWKGTTSTDWSNAANWTNGVPTTNTDVIIGDAYFTGAFQPDLSAPSYCKSITVGNGTKVSSVYIDKSLSISQDITIGENGTVTHFNSPISIRGNWQNTGSYSATHNNSVVSFDGAVQSITGATSFRVLTINTGNTTTLNTNISVTKTFNVKGTFDPGIYLVTFSGGIYFPVAAGAILKVKAATFAGNYSANPTLNALSIVDYASSTINQSISVQSYGTLKISGSTVKTPAGNLTLQSSAATVGNVSITEGTLDLANNTLSRGNSTAGGSITIANNATLKIGGTTIYPSNFSENNLATNSTVEYYGNNQTVSNQLYGNLTLSATSGSVSKTLPGTSLTIANNFTSSVGSGTAVNYTATAPILVNGNITIGSSTTFSGGTSSHVISGNWTNNGTYTPGTGTITLNGTNKVIGGSNQSSFNNLVISGNGITASATTLSVAGNLSTTGAGTFVHNTGGTLTLSGGSKIISGSDLTFSNLAITGSISTTSSFLITGNLTVSGTLNATNGTVEMNGAGKTISGAGTISLFGYRATGTVSTAISFTLKSELMGLGKLTATAGTISLTGSTTYAGAHDLFNVTLNGTKLQLGANSTLGIAGTFTLTSGTFDVTTTVPNTVSYNGTGAQSVTATTYNNLTFAGANTKTAAGSLTVNKLTINTGVTFNASSYTHNIQGNWVNNGTFTSSTSTIQFGGSLDASISGATTFNILTINKGAANNYVSLSSNISVTTLNMTSGNMSTGSNTVTITNTRNGNGIIMGNIKRTHAYTAGVAYAYESPYNTITFTTIVGSVTSVTVSAYSASEDSDPLEGSVNRGYTISVTNTGTYLSTLRLHYEDSELNGNSESTLALWQYNSGWIKSGSTAYHTTNNWVENTLITNLSYTWSLSNDNTTAIWKGGTSSAWETASNWKSGTVPNSSNLIQIGSEAFTNQPIISSAVAIRALTFGSVNASTLTLSSGGSLTIDGSVRGNWTSDAIHNINIGSQTMTVGGDITQGAGNSLRAINISIGSGTLTANGSITQAAGTTLSFSGAGNLFVNNNYNYTGGTFTAGSGTVTYKGSSLQVIAGVTYNNLSLTKTTGTATIASPLVVNGNLSLTTGGILDVNADLTVAGNVTIGSGVIVNENGVTISLGGSWTRSGAFNPTTGTLLCTGSSNQSLSASTFNRVTIDKASGVVSLGGNLVINGNLTITNGTLDLGTYTANRSIIGGILNLGAGGILKVGGAANFPANYNSKTISGLSTIEYNGTDTQSIFQVPYGNLVLTHGGSNTKTLSGSTSVFGNLVIHSGASLNSGSYTLTLQGDLNNSGSFIPTTGNVVLAGTSKTITGSTNFNNLIVTGSYTASAGTNLAVSGNIDLSGSFDAGTNNITTSGDVNISGTYSTDGVTTYLGTRVQVVRLTGSFLSPLLQGLVIFDGSVAPVLNSTATPTFVNVTINNTSTIRTSVDWVVIKEFKIGPGSTFDGSSLTHTYYGPVDNNGSLLSSGVLRFIPSPPYSTTSSVNLNLGSGSSFASTGTVIFGGTRQLVFSSEPISFSNVVVTNTHADGVTPNSNWTMEGDFEVSSNALFQGGNSFIHTLKKDVTIQGTLVGGTSTMVIDPMDSVSTISGSGSISFHHLQIEGPTAAASNFNISGDLINNGIFDPSESALSFIGSSPASIKGSTTPVPFYELIIHKNATSVTLVNNISGLTSLTISGGILDDAGKSIVEDAAGGLLAISTNAKLKIGGTNTLPVFSTYAFDPLSTVEYAGSNQIISPQTYGHLTLSNSGTKALAEGITQANTVTNNSTLDQPEAAVLKLTGHWVNNGTYKSNTSTIEFNGTATQNMSGTAVTTFNNINVTNIANPGVSVQSKQNLKGILTLGNNVNFDSDGTANTAVFTLLSTADDPVQDAAIAPLPSGAQVSGRVTVQRYMAKEGADNYRIYRYISSPLQNATAADLQKELPITGRFTGNSGGTVNSMFSYDETVVTDISNDGVANLHDGFIGFPKHSNTEILQPGRGYAIFVWGNIYPSTLWDVRGYINAGNQTPISFPVTYTSSGLIENDGWNLVGNPFPSVIDWDAATGWTKENLEQSIYIRNNGLEFPNFAVWNGLIGINGGSPYIATGQSFWVKASGEGTPLLKANENIKSSGTTTSFLRTEAPAITNLLRITMIKGSVKDETAIHFRDGATVGFDNNVDSRKMFGGSFNLSSLLADNTRLSINSLPAFNCLASVRLAIDNATSGNYKLDFSSLETFSGSIAITLTDKFTNQSFDISGGGSYNFSISTNAASQGINRFVITFSAAAPKPDFVLNAPTTCEGSEGVIEINNSQLNITYTASKSGSTISSVTGTGGTVRILVPKEKLKVGENSLSIIATAESCSTVIERNIMINLERAPEITSVKSNVQCGSEQVTLTATGAPQPNMYNWYESATSVTPLANQHSATFFTPVIAVPTTYYVAAFNSFGCEGSRKAITAEIVQSIEAKITQSGNTLVSNFETGNQWYFNNQIIPGATQQSIELDKSGFYKLMVSLNTCTSYAEHNFLIAAAAEEPGFSTGTISIYPNPVVDIVRVVTHESTIEAPVKLLNSVGQVLETTTTKLDNGEYACEFDMQNLPSGIYIIRIHGRNNMLDSKLIKK